MAEVLTIGGAVIDYLGFVPQYPKPDEKTVAKTTQVVMGGNCLNASIVLARLGVKAYIATKIAKDYLGNMILDNFSKDGVDTKYISLKENATSPFSYIIVDIETKTRTIVFNPCEELLPGELKEECLDEIKLIVLDGKQTHAAKEIGLKALDRGISSLLDAEDPLIGIPGFSEVVELSEYIKCGENFATKFTHIEEPLRAMEHLLKMQKARKEKKFVITTLGALGSVLMKRKDEKHIASISVSTLAELKEKIGDLKPTHFPLNRCFIYEPKDFECPPTILIYSTSFPIAPSDIKDTTGAGDVFLGSLAFSLLKNHSEEKMLGLASFIAVSKCKGVGTERIPFIKEVPIELL